MVDLEDSAYEPLRLLERAARTPVRGWVEDEDEKGVPRVPMDPDEPFDVEQTILANPSVFADFTPPVFSSSTAKAFYAALHVLQRQQFVSLASLLPIFFQLKGDPYTLHDHFVFEPMFRTRLPKVTVIKAGRQVAKCLELSDEPVVWLGDGRLVGTNSIRVGDRVLAVSGDYRRNVRRVVGVYPSGEKPVYRIRTRLGADFTHTSEHRVRTLLGFTPVAELQPGSRVAAARLGGTFGRKRVDEARLVLTACIVGDGACGVSGNFSITSQTPQVVRTCARLARPFQTFRIRVTRKAKTRARAVHFSQAADSQLVRWLREDGLWGKHAWLKELPAWVFQLSRPQTRQFVSWLWATDGTIKPPKSITYTSTSRTLARQVRSLLAKFGIPASVSRKKAAYKKNGKRKVCRPAWLVRVETRDGLRRFMEQFDVPGKPAFELPLTRENNNRDTIPLEVRSLIAEAAASVRYSHGGSSLLRAGLRLKPKHPLTRQKLAAYVARLEQVAAPSAALRRLQALTREDVIWDEVVSVEYVGVRSTVDFEVEEDHTFCCDGVYTHNSTSLMAFVCLLGLILPYVNILSVAPFFEMVRRLSQQFAKPFIDGSPFEELFKGPGTIQNVLQRTLPTGSSLWFSYALMDATRTRGIPGDFLVFDEIQSAILAVVKIVEETLTGSHYGLKIYSGTPLTFDNPMEVLWQESSQAEFVVRCMNGQCSLSGSERWNIPSREYHLLDMIGPVHDAIGPDCAGLVCRACRKPLDPRRFGRYEHQKQDLRWKSAGYHIPQMLLPLHYADKEKWGELVAKSQGLGNVPFYQFLNEVAGESYDAGTKLLTKSQLMAACDLGHECEFDAALALAPNYSTLVLGVDWGGGGVHKGRASLPHTSYTAIAVVGITSTGEAHTIYGWRYQTPYETSREAAHIAGVFKAFGCHLLAHDAGGHGRHATDLLERMQIPRKQIVNVQYVGEMSEMWMFHAPSDQDPYFRASLDQYFSITQSCELIRARYKRFFTFYDGADKGKSVLIDYTRLLEDKKQRFGIRDSHKITKDPSGPDDFAHADNIATWVAYGKVGYKPDLTRYYEEQYRKEMKAYQENLEQLNREQEVMMDEAEREIRSAGREASRRGLEGPGS